MPGTDVAIRTRHAEFVGRVVSTEDHSPIMDVKRCKGTDAIALNDQFRHFTFGNPNPAFVAVRQAIREVMWGRANIPPTNWLKNLLLTHENAFIGSQDPGNSVQNPKITIRAYDRLNEDQKAAFIAGSSFGASLSSTLQHYRGASWYRKNQCHPCSDCEGLSKW